MKGEKRSLKLMNEILPAPSPKPSGGPRQRTLNHLQRLVAVAAGGAAATACSNGSSSSARPTEPTVDIPGTGVSIATATGTAAQLDVPPKPSASALPTNNPNIGYGVVDPMPPPALCPGLSQTIPATAIWKKEGNGLVIDFKLGKSNRPDAHYVLGQKPTVWGGKASSVSVTADTVTMKITPDQGATSIGASVAAQCSQGNSHVNVNIDVSKPATAGVPVSAQLNDSY